jgi:PAS domain S-box-containing protein
MRERLRYWIAVALLISFGLAQADGGVNRTLVIGSELDFPPLALGMTDESAGGFTVELWKAVAAESGINYTIRVRPFHQILKEFREGKIDILINLAQSHERHEYADFSVPTIVVHGAIFARKGASDIRSEDDLANKSIIVLKADLAHEYAISKGWQKQLVLVNTVADGFRLLASGQHDVLLVGKLVGMHTLEKLGFPNVEVLDVRAGFSQKFSFAVRKGESELLARINDGLALTRSDGTYNALYEKWFAAYEERDVAPLSILKYTLPLATILLGFAGYAFHRRRIERRQSESALEESEKRFRCTFENAPIGIVNVSLDGRFMAVNQGYCDIVGYSREELLTMTFHQLTHPSCQATDAELLRKMLNGEMHNFNIEKQYIRKDGNVIWVSLSVTMLHDSNGSPAYFIATVENIDRRKQIEASLSRSRARLRAILDNMPYMVWFKDCEGKYVQVNKRYAENNPLKDYRKIIGKTDYDFWPRELAESYRAVDAEVMAMREQRLVEEPSLEGGRMRWVETFKSPVVDEGGNLLGTTGFVRDITERKRAEEERIQESERRFQTLFESLGDAVFVCYAAGDGSFGSFAEVNDLACRWLGYTREEVLSMDPMYVFVGDSGTVQGSFTFEQVLVARDGNHIPVEIRRSHFFLRGRMAIILVARDITERKRAELQLREFSTHLQRVREEEKARIAREIHDDLGGILSALRIDTYWLERNLPSGKRTGPFLTRIASMSTLLGNAVTVVRRVITDLRPSVLDDLGLRAAFEWQAAQFQKRTGIECRILAPDGKDCEDKLNQTISINLFRIFQESLTNVSRHSGATIVEVGLLCNDEEIELSISDNGCGMPENYAGVANSYGIRGMFERAESLGGKIELGNAERGGLRVTVRLPIPAEGSKEEKK